MKLKVKQFTYGGDPSNSSRDAVRYYCGDTDKCRPLLDDREIDFSLSKNPNEKMAAHDCCNHLAARFSRESDVTVGPVSKSFSKLAENFAKLADRLKTEACANIRPSAPALYKNDKDSLATDANLTQPSFVRDQFDNPYAVQFDDSVSGEYFYRGI